MNRPPDTRYWLLVAAMVAVILALALLSGCIHLASQRPGGVAAAPASPQRCAQLDHRVLALHLTAVIGSAVGGGAATGAGIFDGTARYVLVGGAAALSLAGAITSYLGGYYAAQYVREGCS